MGTRILVVDDDPAVCDTVEDGLHISGFSTIRAQNGVDAIDIIKNEPIALVVLDVNMPKVSGLDVLQKIRSLHYDTPVLLLTARHGRSDVVEGFRLGADDYVTKPFGLEELILRINAILRRSGTVTSEPLRCGELLIDFDRHEVRLSDIEVDLSPTEFRLLAHLMENKNLVLSKEQLLESVWGIDFESETTVVETYISYLRRKLGAKGSGLIHTIRGVGFSLRDKS